MPPRRSGGAFFFLRLVLQSLLEFEEPVFHLLALGFRGELDGLALGLDGLLQLAVAEETLTEGVENEGGLGLEKPMATKTKRPKPPMKWMKEPRGRPQVGQAAAPRPGSDRSSREGNLAGAAWCRRKPPSKQSSPR